MEERDEKRNIGKGDGGSGGKEAEKRTGQQN